MHQPVSRPFSLWLGNCIVSLGPSRIHSACVWSACARGTSTLHDPTRATAQCLKKAVPSAIAKRLYICTIKISTDVIKPALRLRVARGHQGTRTYVHIYNTEQRERTHFTSNMYTCMAPAVQKLHVLYFTHTTKCDKDLVLLTSHVLLSV